MARGARVLLREAGPRALPSPVPMGLMVRACLSPCSVAAGCLVSAAIGPQGLYSLGMTTGGSRRNGSYPSWGCTGGATGRDSHHADGPFTALAAPAVLSLRDPRSCLGEADYPCEVVLVTLCDLMDCGPPGCSVHGSLQARILEWVAMPFSRGSF